MTKTVINPSGPPFTVWRYGSFGACVTAERDWLREALLRLKRIDDWLDAPAPKGGVWLDHVPDEFMEAWDDSDVFLQRSADELSGEL